MRAVEVAIRSVEPSRTAVVRAPLDVAKILSLWGPVHAYLRGGRTEVRQTGHGLVRGERPRAHRRLVGVYGDPDEQDHVDVEVVHLLAGTVRICRSTRPDRYSAHPGRADSLALPET